MPSHSISRKWQPGRHLRRPSQPGGHIDDLGFCGDGGDARLVAADAASGAGAECVVGGAAVGLEKA